MHTRTVNVAALVIGSVTPAFASEGMTESFSGIFMLVFFGYCAIIVVALTISAVCSLFKRQEKPQVSTEAENI